MTWTLVVRPDGTTELLRVAKEARGLTDDTVPVVGIGDSEWEPGFGERLWAVDVDTAEAFPLRVSLPGWSWDWETVTARPAFVHVQHA